MPNYDSEAADRALVAISTDHALRRLHEAGESTRAEIDNYLAELRESVERQRPAHEARLAEIEESRLAYLRGLHANDGGPPSSQNRAQPEPVDAALAGPSFPVGTAPAGHPDPLADDLQMAQAIRDMDMAEFERSRASFGIRSAASMAHLFGERR